MFTNVLVLPFAGYLLGLPFSPEDDFFQSIIELPPD
jgi:hypothetical protein